VNTDGDYLDIYTKWGRMPVHKHWLDPIPVILQRYNKTRIEGTWKITRDGWVFVPSRNPL
jgi:hypothetical protein